MATLTVKIASPGTKYGTNDSSTVGHMWISLDPDGAGIREATSIGFAPIKAGYPIGAGQIKWDDDKKYASTSYTGTISINDSQYSKLIDFASNPSKYAFNMTYNGASNSCIDFVWKALEIVKINSTGEQGELLPDANIGILDRTLYGYLHNSFGGHGDIFGIRSTSTDVIYGSQSNDYLQAKAETDLIYGGAGNDTIIGNDSANYLNGGQNADFIYGAAGQDTVVGGSGNDSIDGGQGNDKLYGGNDNDTLNGGKGFGNDTIDGGSGIDTVSYLNITSGVSVNLNTTSAQNTGGAGTDTIINIENVAGGSGSDTLTGNSGNNVINGREGDDNLSGGAGNDTIYGGLGKDVLTGGAGKDIFVFDSLPNKSTNVDKITDFNPIHDTIWLDNSVFTKLIDGALSSTMFRSNVNAKALDGNDYLLYNSQTGALSYDADGSGVGEAVQIAQLGTNLALTSSDFFVI